MTLEVTSARFRAQAHQALLDENLQTALGAMPAGFITKRAAAREALEEFDDLRENARQIKDHTLNHLDLYLEAFCDQVTASGGHVHFAPQAGDAQRIVLDICRQAGARSVTKGKSMVSEEIGLNDFLAAHNIEPVETDLGEYAIQLRGERPSHIIAPAVHLRKEQIAADFRRAHTHLPQGRDLGAAGDILKEARNVLRDAYFKADVGITGANFLVAKTGTAVIVTNEGNGDLTQLLPRTHIVLATIDKLVPTLEDTAQILRILARSATGQDMSVYTTFSTGPRRADDPDGPRDFHVVILDNGRSSLLGTDFQDMLRCIRCGACINHCPVYHAVGGHAYGSVYPGPIGSVLTPALSGLRAAAHLPNASTFCGRCESVCPMKIPLPGLMRLWRKREFEERLTPPPLRYGVRLWSALARRPALYRTAFALGTALMRLGARGRGFLGWLPLGGGWTAGRDMPAPQGRSFLSRMRDIAEESGDS